MAKITWKVHSIKANPPECYDLNCLTGDNIDWVTVRPLAGDDTTNNITITATEPTCPSDLTAAFVIISASTGDIQIIPVTRCKSECLCSTIKFSATTTTTDYTAKRIEIGKYSQDCQVCVEKSKVETDGTVLKNPTMSNGHIYADVTKNEGCSVRNGSYKFICENETCLTGTISQTRYINPCENTDASKVGVSFAGGGTSKTVDYNSHSLSFNINYVDNCWGLTSSASSVSWITLNNNDTISISEYSDTSSDRSGTATFEFKSSTQCGGDKTCTKTLSITQEKKPLPQCNCDSLTATGKTIGSPGGNGLVIGSFTKIDCMSNVRATSSVDWLSSFTISGNDVKANVSSNVKETATSQRTATVTITVDKTGGGTCTRDMTVKQEGHTPTPIHCEIDGHDEIDSCGGGTEQYTITQS